MVYLWKHQHDFLHYWKNVLPIGVLEWKRGDGKTYALIRIICEKSIDEPNYVSYVYFYLGKYNTIKIYYFQ